MSGFPNEMYIFMVWALSRKDWTTQTMKCLPTALQIQIYCIAVIISRKLLYFFLDNTLYCDFIDFPAEIAALEWILIYTCIVHKLKGTKFPIQSTLYSLFLLVKLSQELFFEHEYNIRNIRIIMHHATPYSHLQDIAEFRPFISHTMANDLKCCLLLLTYSFSDKPCSLIGGCSYHVNF